MRRTLRTGLLALQSTMCLQEVSWSFMHLLQLFFLMIFIVMSTLLLSKIQLQSSCLFLLATIQLSILSFILKKLEIHVPSALQKLSLFRQKMRVALLLTKDKTQMLS